MSFSCHRCFKTFATETYLQNHFKHIKDHPCDFVCYDCGRKMDTYVIFKKHKKTKCKYVPKSNKETSTPKQIPTTSNSQTDNSSMDNSHNTHKTNNNHSHNTNNITNNVQNTFNITLPHGKETNIDKEELIGEIVEKILFRLDTGVSGKANWGTVAFKDSFHQMFSHIYANKDKPDQQNLLLKDQDTRELQIFNGNGFVDDKLSSEERMTKILHFLGDGLKWMVSNCDNYSEEDKEAKSAKIDRVLTGIPRFKITYKAMFDNIFNTLNEIKNDIEERQTIQN